MTVTDAGSFPAQSESFERHFAVLASSQILDRVARLSEEAYADYLGLLAQYRAADSAEDRREILSTLVEIVLDEPVTAIPIEDVEREARSTLEGAAAGERFERQARVFGENLRRFRRVKKMTQEALADASNMTQPQISYLERGEHHPQEATVAKLAEALGVSPEELLPLG